MASKYLTASQVADQLGISIGSVYGAINSGDLVSLRVGKTYRIPVDCFTAWLDKITVPVSSPAPAPAPQVRTIPVSAPSVPFPAQPKPDGVPLRRPTEILMSDGLPLPKIDLICLRHPGFAAWLKRHGILAPMVDRATAAEVRNKNVIGSIPLELAMLTSRIFVIKFPAQNGPFNFPALNADDLDRMGAYVLELAIQIENRFDMEAPDA
jgi:excisionase family DNA binding protein